MMTSKEREQLSELNGTATPLSRDSYKTSSSGPWRHNPTPITPSSKAPSNDPPMLRMVHPSGSNPYGGNPNRRRVGNPTSNRVLGGSNNPPFRKKVKTEHTPHEASGDPYSRQGDRNNTRSKRNHEIPIDPEPIDVDDYVVMPGDTNHTRIGNSSPDELNIRSSSIEGVDYPSKYKFDMPSHGSTIRNNNPPIVPDGEHTEWAKNTFPQGPSNHSTGIPAPSGQVREEIAKIEAKTRRDQPKVIDFNRMRKTKERMGKKKENKLFRQPAREQPPREQPSRAPAKKKVLPLKGLYLDHTHHTEKLEIQWLSNDKITIKSDRSTIFGPFDIRVNAHSLTYHDCPDPPAVLDPVFKLVTIPGGRSNNAVKCVTVNLDCSGPGAEESYYTDLLDWLKARVEKKELIRPSAAKSLWDSVHWAGARESEFSTNQGDSGKSRMDELRQGEPQRAMRSLVDDRSNLPQKRSASQTSLRITPSPSSTTVSGNQKPKQRSRQDTSNLPVVPRRSTRNTSGSTRSPAVDNDEVILVYPPGVPGAVNITNGDFLRLQPNEFLNDTLIEFGLKLWLKDLEQTKPILASQIHVFNSFFYKKLNHQKKGTNLGYESVRKWTSKFDIFQKKYIIVPINEHLHWYFAIICDPEYVLIPTAPNVPPSTRQQTRQSISESMVLDEPNETSVASKPASTSVSENGKDEDKLGTSSEVEVEDTLHNFQGSCNISNIEPGENVADLEGERSPSALSYVSDDAVLRPLSPTASDHERVPLRHSSSDENMAMDGGLPANHDDPVPQVHPVDAASFYQPVPHKGDKGKRKADPQPDSFVMEIDDDDDDGGSVPSDTPKTYIFTFDSLGGKHPQAINKLSAYLKMEAKDKKKVENASNAEGKSVLVPSQPNFCDCGIYLLHLAQTFMSDPVHYRRMILTQRSKAVPNPERQIAWHDHQVSDIREGLRARIMKLSGEWKKERAAKEEAKHKETSNSHNVEVIESSDCEIDILEPTPSSSKARKKKSQAANRLRG